jgi:hypothetical protein
MDSAALDIIRELANARTHFFRRPYVFRTHRDDIASTFLDVEASYINVLSGILQRTRTPITISFPITTNFSDPVPVLPSAAQIADELEDYASNSVQNCAICQEQIVSDGGRLRTCQHVYHRACIRTWFDASVRCPVCRRDIREGPATGTSSGATGTQPLQTSQWGGEESQEWCKNHHTVTYETHDEYRADILSKFEERQNLGTNEQPLLL